ncbi:MAG: hypothetical protein KDJ75_01805 [Alphaproteobacteria bacterium]|nr:hypothetical protein [Alphaproteobacteria bacterium]
MSDSKQSDNQTRNDPFDIWAALIGGGVVTSFIISPTFNFVGNWWNETQDIECSIPAKASYKDSSSEKIWGECAQTFSDVTGRMAIMGIDQNGNPTLTLYKKLTTEGDIRHLQNLRAPVTIAPEND